MRSGPHWNDYPPDDPPEPAGWCSEHGRALDEGEDCYECAEIAEWFEMFVLFWQERAQLQLTWPQPRFDNVPSTRQL